MEVRETKIYVGRTSHIAKIPKYETELSAGMDVSSAGRYIVFPRQKLAINTGLVIAIQSLSSIDIRPRSGLSLKTPFEICNAPGTIDADYRKEVGVIMQNTSLPSYENWVNDEYVKLWNYLEENGMKNGELSEEDVKTVESKFGQLYTLKQEGNLPGIYLINPGDRVAQIKMGDDTRIRFITEEFLTDEQIEDLKRQGYTEDDIFKETEEIRTKHLQKVKTMGHDRGGGYGSTGING